MKMATKFPLLVQFEFHPESKEAAAAAAYLHEVLNADPAVPGLQIPTIFTPDDGSGEPPEPKIADEAHRVLVVLLAEDHLAAAARRKAKSGRSWGDYAVQLRTLAEAGRHRFMPVQLTEHGYPVDKRLDSISFLRAWAFDSEEERHKCIARRLVHLLIRRLRPHDENEDAAAATIFLSHAKADLEKEPGVVKSLLQHLTAEHPENTWFDSGDIASGSRFGKEIEKGVKDTALLAVVTDAYSSREWCRREVLLAKQNQRPVVIVDAVQVQETRRFPYSGNTPVIRWQAGRAQDVVDLLLRESLRHAYAEENLKLRQREGDDLLFAGPELLTIVHRDKAKPVLYPDPPLGIEELDVLSHTGVSVETPLERHARAHDLRGRGLLVALSISEAEDLKRFGLRQAHLDAIFLELSRYLLVAGVRLAYGGHLGKKGYTDQLATLVRDPVIDQLRGRAPDDAAPAELVNYLAWPMVPLARDEARLGPLVEVIRCERPAEVTEVLDARFVEAPQVELPSDSAAERFAWARGLAAMRARQTADVSARIVIGGRTGLSYRGRMPGVLEETLLTFRAKRPLYLVGAFGGCARLVLDALDGAPRAELTSQFHSQRPHTDDVKKLYVGAGLKWDEFEEVAAEFKAGAISDLNNGLTVEENRELATTRSAERIVELVLRGIQQCNPPAAAAGDAE